MFDESDGLDDALRIQLLGGFRASRGTQAIDPKAWGLRNASRVVKLLALEPDLTLHREQIMDWLWPDLPPAAAANNLRYTLHVTRRILRPLVDTPDEILSPGGQRVTLAPQQRVRVDVTEFEESAASALASGDPDLCEQALALYGGELLPGDRYEDWAAARRESLRVAFLRVLVELARLREQAGDLPAAIDALERVVATDPLHEEAHAGLMRLYSRQGRRHQSLRQFALLRDTLRRELDVDPAPESLRLYQDILTARDPGIRDEISGQIPDPETTPARKHNLPMPLTNFVGRQREIAEVSELLRTNRLLTLTGSGGAGKTRLAVKVAERLVDQFADGVWLVDLSALTGSDLVVETVSTALGLTAESEDVLVGSLRSRRLLLVLDNCEHLVSACAALVDTLLRSCPEVYVLATSRERLQTPGEYVWRVPPLTFPDETGELTVEQVGASEAGQLFTERAAFARPGFRVTAENVEAIARICRQLDGIPLAIELAAARLMVLTPDQLAGRLSDALRLLAGGDRAVVPRHQTLRAALDWSFDLLSDTERLLFIRLAVFAGGWTLEAAEAAVSGQDLATADVLDVLASLVDKSLVTVEPRKSDLRYRLLTPVQQYAREQLRESGEEALMRQRHAEHMLAFVEEMEPQMRGATQAWAIERLDAEHDNLRAALAWSLDADPAVALRLAAYLGRFWYIRSYLIEGRRMLDAALASAPAGNPATRAMALQQAGVLADEAGEHDEAARLLEGALAIFRELGESARLAAVLNSLGVVARSRGDLARSREYFEESLDLRRQLQDPVSVNLVLSNLAAVAWSLGDLDRAESLFEETLVFDRAAGDDWSIAIGVAHLGRIAWERREYARSRDFFDESRAMAMRAGDDGAVIEGLEGLAGALGPLGEPRVAARLWGAADALRESMSLPVPSPERAFYDRVVALGHSLLGDTAFADTWSAGRGMTLDDALALAEDATSRTRARVDRPPATSSVARLTPRQHEIAALIARGLTNQQIAGEIGVSVRTADTHVSNILRALGVSSRAGVAQALASLSDDPTKR